MNRLRARALAAASLSMGLLSPARGHAASLTQVNRSDWAGSVKLPSYVQMYIYVPDKLAAKPPIMVSSHSCGSTATGQMGNIPLSKDAADKNGFILILPDNPGQNCWDVGSPASLKHDGGGDTQAIVQMVKYALMKYGGDPARVYAMGGSSGAMMTQALMAVYPDVFRAGSARAGVPAGCWADGYDSTQQWSNNCAGGNTTKTAQQWGDLVRAMDPGYSGHRPRLQTMQGEADTTISYKNTAESVKEWTNVLGLSTEPSSSDKGYKAASATYDRQFWQNACGYVVFETWSSPGGTHSMAYEEADILKFFGLDTAGGSDPEPDCPPGGSGGSGGAPGAGGMNNLAGASATGGAVASGGRPAQGGMSGVSSGAGGTVAGGGATAAGGSAGSRGASDAAGGAGSGLGGMVASTGGSVSAGGAGATSATGGTGATSATGGSTTVTGGQPGSGGAPSGTGGTGAAGKTTLGSGGSEPAPDGGGCSIARADGKARHDDAAAFALGLGLLAFRRRARR